jgi:hypothetical protein
LAHGRTDALLPFAVKLAETAVLVPVGVSLQIFLAKELKGNAFLLEFYLNFCPIGRRQNPKRRRRRRGIEKSFKPFIVEPLGKGPRKACRLGALEAIRHGAASDSATLGNLASGKLAFKF